MESVKSGCLFELPPSGYIPPGRNAVGPRQAGECVHKALKSLGQGFLAWCPPAPFLVPAKWFWKWAFLWFHWGGVGGSGNKSGYLHELLNVTQLFYCNQLQTNTGTEKTHMEEMNSPGGGIFLQPIIRFYCPFYYRPQLQPHHKALLCVTEGVPCVFQTRSLTNVFI